MRRRFAASVVLMFAPLVSASAADNSAAIASALDAYAQPATLVDVGGRKLNLRCSGSGKPTVVLEAGATADSLTWHKVQPLVAKSARVCSYDRAGYGFSDDGPPPRDLDADAKDLHALLRAARLELPAILVGHSLGTNIVRRYAEQNPADVAGIVLVDPPPQRIADFSADWVKTDQDMHKNVIAFAELCEKAASAGALGKPASDETAKCIRPPDPDYPTALNAAIHAQKEKPPFWHTLISEFKTNMTLFEQPVSPSETHGSTPLIVLVADNAFADAPPDGKNAMEAARQKTNQLILKTSTRSERRWIANSSHDMQLDQPEAVATAIADVIEQSRGASGAAK